MAWLLILVLTFSLPLSAQAAGRKIQMTISDGVMMFDKEGFDTRTPGLWGLVFIEDFVQDDPKALALYKKSHDLGNSANLLMVPSVVLGTIGIGLLSRSNEVVRHDPTVPLLMTLSAVAGVWGALVLEGKSQAKLLESVETYNRDLEPLGSASMDRDSQLHFIVFPSPGSLALGMNLRF